MLRRILRRASPDTLAYGSIFFWLCGLAAEDLLHNRLSATLFYAAQLIMAGGVVVSGFTEWRLRRRYRRNITKP
jgi:hypothetical protein